MYIYGPKIRKNNDYNKIDGSSALEIYLEQYGFPENFSNTPERTISNGKNIRKSLTERRR